MDKSAFVMLLLGPSGVGKSSVKRYLEATFGFESAPKFTTRSRRATPDDDQEFIFCQSSADMPTNDVLSFQSYGARFGIQLSPIGDSLRRGRHHVLTVGDVDTVRALEKLYPRVLRTVLVYCDQEVLRFRMSRSQDIQRTRRLATIEHEIASIWEWLGVVRFVIDNSGPFTDTTLQVADLVKALEVMVP